MMLKDEQSEVQRPPPPPPPPQTAWRLFKFVLPTWNAVIIIFLYISIYIIESESIVSKNYENALAKGDGELAGMYYNL